MGKLMKEDITGKEKSTLMSDSFKEVVEFYKDCDMEVFEEAALICIYDTDGAISFGGFPKADIIINYNRETGRPGLITARAFRKNYKFSWWIQKIIELKFKQRTTAYEGADINGERFNLHIDFQRKYIDYELFKEEWFELAKKNAKVSF